jgi:hypothetical protein
MLLALGNIKNIAQDLQGSKTPPRPLRAPYRALNLPRAYLLVRRSTATGPLACPRLFIVDDSHLHSFKLSQDLIANLAQARDSSSQKNLKLGIK